ncbi:MAG: protoheme IX farnesyltransferase [Rhodospirillales bacterium]|nr:protoheme IX farnesyltransferase [Rhodospirillales bacterium]
MKAQCALFYSVFKIRIGLAIMASALVGSAVMPGPALTGWQLLILALTVLGSSAAAGAFNQLVERDLDGRMKRTANRPFVTGRLRAGPGWYIIILSLLVVSVGTAFFALNGASALYVFLGAFFYGVVYTVWLKRRTVWNIVIGGLSGSFAVLAGAAAVDPGLSATALGLAVILFLWTPPHFWSLAAVLRDDYAQAGIPMLPAIIDERAAAWTILINTVGLVIASMMLTMYGLGWSYWLMAATGGSYFLYRSVQYVMAPSPETAMKNFFASLVQLCLLFIGVFLGAMTGL